MCKDVAPLLSSKNETQFLFMASVLNLLLKKTQSKYIMFLCANSMSAFFQTLELLRDRAALSGKYCY